MAAKLLGTNLCEGFARIRTAFSEGINSVQPWELIKKFVRRENGTLVVNNKKHELHHNVYIVGFGKAVIGMVRPLEDLLKDSDSSSHLKGGILSVPFGIQDTFSGRSRLLPTSDSVIEILEGAKNNIPDESAFTSARKICSLVQSLSEKDLLIVLISGGGSALLPYPLAPTTLEEKQDIVKTLSRAGADIIELNTVRKALSATKGGKLAAMTKAQTVSLILSDVINSPLDMIASGPTVVNRDSVGAALNILSKYSVSIPYHTKAVLENAAAFSQELPHVTNVLVGSNEAALTAVATSFLQKARGTDCSMILSSCLQGEASDIGKKMSEFVAVITSILCGSGDTDMLRETLFTDLCIGSRERVRFIDLLEKVSKDQCPICLIFGGETTVHVKGTGLGGRNQEMVLSYSIHMEKVMEESAFSGEVLFLSGGTDGIDGPTDAAGAITYWSSISPGFRSQLQEAEQQDLNPEAYLQNNDSYTYFSLLSNGYYLLKPGHTGTNVMDIQILMIYPWI
ncbi:glycerate kinase-like [Macrobrachium nipponense]|uniref:glycerate kinase-like n=1 Tax=Macrobrachium nipponense TaxID=159736 RepID=UPI0030C8184D